MQLKGNAGKLFSKPNGFVIGNLFDWELEPSDIMVNAFSLTVKKYCFDEECPRKDPLYVELWLGRQKICASVRLITTRIVFNRLVEDTIIFKGEEFCPRPRKIKKRKEPKPTN